ncbi:hypothetical protein Tco_0667789, partial [Tanacetum coccineum]
HDKAASCISDIIGYSLARGLAIDQWAKELGQPVDELERADTLTQEQTHWDAGKTPREATGCKDNNYSIVVHDGGCRCGCSKDYVDTSYLDLGCEGRPDGSDHLKAPGIWIDTASSQFNPS